MDPLDSDRHIDIMHTSYFYDFERISKNNQWWIDKKARVYCTFENSKKENPSIRAQAKAQVMVNLRILFDFVTLCFYKPVR